MPAARLSADSEHGIAFPDAYSVTSGHTLVVPRNHVESLFELPGEVQADLWRLVSQVRRQLAGEPEVAGFTVGVNDGKAAGQTIPHAHIHIIPRRFGDVPDPRGGLRWVIPQHAAYWKR